MPRTQDDDHDRKVLTRVYSLLEEHPGDDSFCIYMAVNGGTGLVQMDFPNVATHYTPAIDAQLRDLVGGDRVRIE